jgi:hypothetical protein
MIGMFMISLIYASQTTLSEDPFEAGENILLVQLCADCTYNNITSVISPNGTTILVSNVEMTKQGTEYQYILSGGNTTESGTYNVNGVGDLGGDAEIWSYTFEVTKTGEKIPGDSFTIFIYILFLIAFIGLFATFFLTIVKLAMANETLYGVLLTWFFFILMLITNFLSKNYLMSNYILNLSDLMITITTWTNGVLPLISFIFTMIIKGFKKVNPINPQELTGGKLMRYG